MVDEIRKVSLAAVADTSILRKRVAHELTALVARRGQPTVIISNHILRGGRQWLRSCPCWWCSFGVVTTITGWGRDDQAARVGRLTRGSSPIGAMLSRVM